MEAQPLVLLPGNGANSLSWMSNVRALSTGYKTFNVDNIYDYGRSIYTRPFKDPGDFMSWLDELSTALALSDKINLMGISFGGWLASQCALRYPRRLARILLLVPAAKVLPISAGFTLRTLPCVVAYRPYFRIFMRWMFLDSAPEAVDKFVGETLFSRKCYLPRTFVLPTILTDQELQSIQMPALFLVGEHEKLYFSHKAVQRLNTVAPQIKNGIIPQASHELLAEQAEMVKLV